ncbi:DUF983 domain-containing protein [Amaricoccus solimangrovi]|uniref:DUF983 domain-containing protein n=1 Tax=Amaricoccus solimangrovi TaxID=2589815 RepID=A0A501WS76_9RHOB|nr:DUF983 domain-containing protein [Amaricoccus solimangrovi]TPE51692.1 DUF983 domain-containing protein [Amaricoccus solimangrovi]
MTEGPDRALGEAIRNGLRRRCPACGEGRLFDSYLHVAPECPACREALHHQRADDGPAYVTLLVVCHVVGFALIPLVTAGLRPWLVAVLLSLLAVPLCLAMLPPIKGFFVAVQWAKRMHGFGEVRVPSA